MNCKETRAKLSLYLDGMLPQKEARLVGQHLHSCESCGKEARELAEISRLLGQIPQKPVPDEFWERMSQALREEKKDRKPQKNRNPESQSRGFFTGRKRIWRTAAGAAAVFLVCFLSYSLFSDHLTLPDTGAGERAAKHLNADQGSQTDQAGSVRQPGEMESGSAPGISEGESEPASKVPKPVTKKSGSNAPSSTERESSGPNALSTPGRESSGSNAPSAPASESSGSDSAPAPASPFAAPAQRAGEPEENFLRSRSFSADSDMWAVRCDQAVSNLTDAVNQKDLKKMKQAVKLAGYTDRLEDRAKVALSFYQSVFGDDPVSWEFVKEEPEQKAPDQMLRQYRLSSKNSALGLSVTQKDDGPALQEGILEYSYDVDQAMAGDAYQLKAYTPENEAGCPEFTLAFQENSTGADQTITLVGCGGKISRKDAALPVPAKAPDNMEEN